MAAPTRLGRWLGELRRRRVVRVAVAYLIAAWLLIQVAAETFEPLGLPDWALKLVIVVAVLGFPVALMPDAERNVRVGSARPLLFRWPSSAPSRPSLG